MTANKIQGQSADTAEPCKSNTGPFLTALQVDTTYTHCTNPDSSNPAVDNLNQWFTHVSITPRRPRHTDQLQLWFLSVPFHNLNCCMLTMVLPPSRTGGNKNGFV